MMSPLSASDDAANQNRKVTGETWMVAETRGRATRAAMYKHMLDMCTPAMVSSLFCDARTAAGEAGRPGQTGDDRKRLYA